MRWFIVAAALVAGLVTAAAEDQKTAPPPLPAQGTVAPATAAYLEALEHLEAGRADEAVAAFTKLIESNPDEPAFHVSRGVALALLQKLPEAAQDLQRALKLRSADAEAAVWLDCVNGMAAGSLLAGQPGGPYESFVRTTGADFGAPIVQKHEEEKQLADWGPGGAELKERMAKEEDAQKRQVDERRAEREKRTQETPGGRRNGPTEEERHRAEEERRKTQEQERPERARRQAEDERKRQEGEALRKEGLEKQKQDEEARWTALDKYRRDWLAGRRAQAQARHEAAVKNLPVAGAWYARRAKQASIPVVHALFLRAQQRYQQREYEAALGDLAYAAALYPDDPNVLYYRGSLYLALGDPTAARQELTRVLIARTDFGQAYLGRALASARLGVAKRARSDLEVGARLSPKDAETTKAAVEQELAAIPADAAKAPDVLYAGLEEAARSGATQDVLIERALVLLKSSNARRLRHDEDYQDHLRSLSEALRGDPKNATRLMDLAEYLRDQSTVPCERIAGRNLRYFRHQVSEAAELNAAADLVDRALQLDPRNVRALVYRARAMVLSDRWKQAAPVIERALEAHPDSPEVLDLFGSLFRHAALVKTTKADGLRTTKIWSDADYVYTHFPSDAELEKADEYDAEASRLQGIYEKQIERALAACKSTPRGFYYQGCLHSKTGDPKAARAAWEQAVKLDPTYLPPQESLARICARLGDKSAAVEWESSAANLVETTCVPFLRVAGFHIQRTAWKSAREWLARCRALDPANPRLPTYLGIVALGEQKRDEAILQFRIALALEEARVRLHGRSLAPGARGPLLPEDCGLTLSLRLACAEQLGMAGKLDEALAVYRSIGLFEARIPRPDLSAELPSAELPSPSQQAGQEEERVSVLELLLHARNGIGRVYLAQNKTREAVAAFESVAAFARSDEHAVGPPGLACWTLANLYFRAGDPRTARNYLEHSWKHFDADGKALEEEILKAERQLHQQPQLKR